ncbi:MAG: transaldolase, partial [Vicinamibacterales bacterium]
LQRLYQHGQSVWLDYIDRGLLHDGRLVTLIERDALVGMTSNPTIFEKALAEGAAYDAQVSAASPDLTPAELFELIETDDVRTACDRFAGVFEDTEGQDGYVSIEVSPSQAFDADATVIEARRLWKTVDRPNVMVKVPGTPEGARAIRRLIGEGINVNVTLLFAIEAHARVIEAYLSGLEDRVAAGQPIDRVASVASFFVSRVDTEIDKRLNAMAADASNVARDHLLSLRGKAAIANARLAYRLFSQRFSVGDARWDRLAALGAMVQRPLWASTSTKNPAYRDVIYVEQLIGPHTVDTLPTATMEAFRDHGVVARTVDMDVAGAEVDIAALEAAGISLAQVTEQLLTEGVASFQRSFDSLLAGLRRKTASLVAS